MLRSILSFISILPLVIILFASSLNINQQTRIKLLTWKSPQISLGVLMASISFSSFLLSSFYLYTISTNSYPLKRKYTYTSETTSQNDNDDQNTYIEEEEEYVNENNYINEIKIERDIRDPQPTLSVPFRVIKKGNSNIINDLSEENEEGFISEEISNDNKDFPQTETGDWGSDRYKMW